MLDPLDAAAWTLNEFDSDVFDVLGDPRLRDVAAAVVRAYLDALDPANECHKHNRDHPLACMSGYDFGLVIRAIRPAEASGA